MINGVLVDRKLPAIRGYEHLQKCLWPLDGAVEFQPGVNIIFGPNGVGKSTLLDLIAHWCQCKDGGRQKVTEDSLDGIRSGGAFTIAHDGAPVVFVSANHRPGMKWGLAQFDFDFVAEQVSAIQAEKLSSGNNSMHHMVPFFEIMLGKQTPELLKLDVKTWPLRGLNEKDPDAVEAIKGVTRDQRTAIVPTVLLDEPDRALDVVFQSIFWQRIREWAPAPRAQVIITSHSPFALGIEGAHYHYPNRFYADAAAFAVRQLTPQLPEPTLDYTKLEATPLEAYMYTKKAP